MPQNSSSFTPFDRTVFVQAMFMSFNLVFSTIFNSLLRHRSFFSTACAIQTEQTNVQHFYCLYGCVVWRPHQPDYRIIKYDCVFDSLLSAQWQNFDFSIRLAFFSPSHSGSVCECATFSFVSIFNLFVWRWFFQPEYFCRWTDEHECHLLNWENILSPSTIYLCHIFIVISCSSNISTRMNFGMHVCRLIFNHSMICRAEFYASTTSIHGSVI